MGLLYLVTLYCAIRARMRPDAGAMWDAQARRRVRARHGDEGGHGHRRRSRSCCGTGSFERKAQAEGARLRSSFGGQASLEPATSALRSFGGQASRKPPSALAPLCRARRHVDHPRVPGRQRRRARVGGLDIAGWTPWTYLLTQSERHPALSAARVYPPAGPRLRMAAGDDCRRGRVRPAVACAPGRDLSGSRAPPRGIRGGAVLSRARAVLEPLPVASGVAAEHRMYLPLAAMLAPSRRRCTADCAAAL